jgi:Ca2+-binding RTX toxin-like protein
MTVSTGYSLSFVSSLSPAFITANTDAASLANGGFAVIGDHTTHIDGTYFAEDGTVAASPTSFTGSNGAVSQLDNGDIVVVGDGGTDIFFRITDVAGNTVVASKGIGESGDDVLNPDVAGGIPGDRFVIAYQDFFGGIDSDINWEIRNADGTLFAAGAPNSSTTINDQFPSVSVLNDGGFVVAWQRNVGSETEIWYSVINADGTVRLAETLLDTAGTINRLPTTVALKDGGFAILYEDNGWDGDRDITYARFDANGAFQTWADISDNTVTDSDPSATVLSNGMVLVGSTNAFFADTDPTWTLVDPATGAILTSTSSGFTFNNDAMTAVAGMANGKVATLLSDLGAGTVTGQVLQTTRTSISDAASDTIIVDSLRDVASGNAGNDTFQGGGLDAFTNDTIDGGADSDRILATGDISLVDTTLTSIEEIEYLFPSPALSVTVRADQIGAGLASNLVVDFSANSTADKFRVEMRGATSVDLSQLQVFDFFPDAPEGDRIIVLGDDDSETIRGTSVRDELFGTGGNDVLEGGLGGDYLSGGLGSDRASYANAAAGVVAALLSPATNTGEAAGDTFASIENLTGSAFADKLTGTNSTNSLIGGADSDTVIGLGGDDNLFGQDGNDVLNGGAGADNLSGGAGSDRATYETAAAGVVAALLSPATNTGDAAGDTYASIESLTGSAFGDRLTGTNSINSLIGGAGSDKIFGLGGDDNLFGQDGNDVLVGGAGADALSGGNDSDTASYETAAAGVVASLTTPAVNTGDAAGDTYSSIENLTGSTLGDVLTGNSVANKIAGGSGSDSINGRGGSDTLTGNAGNDSFVFDTTLGAGNVDTIGDFNVANDTIRLDNAIFDAIAGVGTLTAAQFVANASGTAADANDRIVYETDTGKLFYDINGNAVGGSIQFATLTAGLALTNADFVIF